MQHVPLSNIRRAPYVMRESYVMRDSYVMRESYVPIVRPAATCAISSVGLEVMPAAPRIP